jgi:hypothetical protein
MKRKNFKSLGLIQWRKVRNYFGMVTSDQIKMELPSIVMDHVLYPRMKGGHSLASKILLLDLNF